MNTAWLRAIVVIVVVCSVVLLRTAAFGQSPVLGDPVAKPDRDAPFPTQPAGLSESAIDAAALSAADSIEQWTKLAYQSSRDGNWDIYLAAGNGTKAANLTRHQAADARPQLNRGATAVVFNSDRDGNAEIYVVNADGSGLRRLTADKASDFAAHWSPDGQFIAFVSNRSGNNEIFVMRADGSSPVQMTHDAAADTSPAWSPDGKWIAWKRTSAGISTIYIMHPDGSGVAPILTNGRYVGDISWSPASDKLLTDADVDGDNWNELIQIQYAGASWIYNTISDAQQPLVDLWAGAYAPDGAAVAYARVQYVIDGRYLKMQRADLQQYVLVDQRTTAIPGGGSDVNPSWQSADLLPPTSQVLPLPEYGRAGRMRVRWEGTDPGPSGLSGFDVEYATAAAGPWLPFVTDTKATAADLLLDQPGTTVWLRTRARDQAGNVEAWPVKPDTQAQLYVWDVSGSAIDNRGITVPAGTWVSSPGALNTGASNSAGAYRAVYAGEGTYALDMKAPGFADSEPTQVRLNADARLDFGLRPPGDVIENGSFENGLSGWVGDGSIVQGDLAAGAHSGSNGLALGANCGFPCLSAPQLTGLPLGIYAAAADHFGNMHVALIVENALLYAMHDFASGAWSAAETVYGFPNQVTFPKIAVDGNGGVYIGVRSGSLLLYVQKQPGGAWTAPVELAGGTDPDIPSMVGDRGGGVHILYHTSFRGQSYYTRVRPGEAASAPVLVNGDLMDVAPDGTVHLVGKDEYSTKVSYESLSPQGQLSSPVVLVQPAYYFDPRGIAVGPKGEVHLVLWSAEGLQYAYCDPAGLWTKLQIIPGFSGDGAMLQIDGAGTAYLVGATTNGMYYQVKSVDSGWTQPMSTDLVSDGVGGLSVAANGAVQLITQDSGVMGLTLRSSPKGTAGARASSAQAVQVPAQMQHPTLSFFYKGTAGDPNGSASLAVGIDDSTGATVVFSAPAAPAWTQAWVDMAPWLGEQITITFSAGAPAGEPAAQFYLDDIALAAWTTPVVGDVEPATITSDWTGKQITIHGDNFTPAASLRLNSTRIETVTCLDAQTLQAILPAGLGPGRYDVWVSNPDQQQNVASGALTLGSWQYMPAIGK